MVMVKKSCVFLSFFCCMGMVQAAPACLQGVESAYQPFYQVMQTGGLQARLESVNLANLQRRLQSAQAAVNRWPVSVDVSTQPYQQDSRRNSFSGRTETVSVSVDLVETVRGQGRTSSQLEQQRVELSLVQQQLRLQAQTLVTLVEMAALNDLQELLTYRKTLLQQRVEYFSIRREMGDSVSTELLDTESRLLETLNKLDAIRIRQTTESLKLVAHQQQRIQPNTLALPSIRQIPTTIHLSCQSDTAFSVQDKYLASQLADREISKFRQRQGIQIGFFSNLVNEKVENAQAQKTTTTGVKFTYNLWSGGAGHAEETALVNAHFIAQDELVLQKQLEADRIENWHNSKTVFLNAMRANQIKIEALQQQVVQLEERRLQEAGMFVVASDTQLQLSLLLESDIGVRKDFIVANLNLLAAYNPHI